MQKIDKNAEVNKYPYFLWLNHRIEDLEIDYENKIISGKNGTSSFSNANKIEVFLLKYIPILVVLYFILRMPTLDDMLGIFISFFITLVTFLLYKTKKILFLKIFIFALLFGTFFFALLFGQEKIENTFFTIMHYIGIYIIFLYLYFDYKEKDFRRYYKLDAKKRIEKTVIGKGQRKMMRIPFTKKHILRYQVRDSFNLKFSLGGFYFCELKERKF